MIPRYTKRPTHYHTYSARRHAHKIERIRRQRELRRIQWQPIVTGIWISVACMFAAIALAAWSIASGIRL